MDLDVVGHLVAIRSADLASLHVHPVEKAAGPGEVRFAVTMPSAGTYRLFFAFKHQGTAHGDHGGQGGRVS